jgi:hypothetical protein
MNHTRRDLAPLPSLAGDVDIVRRALTLALSVLTLVSLFAAEAVAQDAGGRAPGPRSIVLFPTGDVVPVYVADPYRPTNLLQERFHTSTEIPDAAGVRTALAAGGRFGILRVGAPSSGRAWQVSLDAGLDAVFDAKHKLDGIGWDGNYGLSVTTASESPWAFRFGIQHLSAHLGDEYQERTGRTRVDYTREEVLVAAVRRLGSRSRVYGEIAGAYSTTADSQAPWRLQAGIEHEGTRRFVWNQFTWYAAADLQSLQERDWRLDTALELGLVAWRSDRAYRVGAAILSGRPTLGEFSELSENSFSLFLKIDI